MSKLSKCSTIEEVNYRIDCMFDGDSYDVVILYCISDSDVEHIRTIDKSYAKKLKTLRKAMKDFNNIIGG